ncbi:GFA family protein [Inquilinus sp. OTU3971]|uniref:GFA family protein n=1 Tax=Inquilinus sp. OTU3971 TaxID=3043855 RepID=UPI00313B2977
MTDHTGGCLCGGVRYRVTGPLRQVVTCHCGQCRRTSGHFAAFTACAAGDLVLESDRTLRWYRSSPEAERGFCGECGASLFWKLTQGGTVSIAAGTLDGATGLGIGGHLYTVDKGDYYSIADGAPQWREHPDWDDPAYPQVPGLG